MKIKIAYLYYDLLNLYGDSGNVKVLKKQLDNQGINTEIHFLTTDDELDFNKYDLIYIGAGTENNQKIALKHLTKYKDDIKNCIENNKFFLITGNSIEMFGKYIIDKNENKYEALGIFPYHAKETNFRMIEDCIFKSEFLNDYVIGFQNQSSTIFENVNQMFEVISGIGSHPNSQTEGVLYNNFYGTYLIGPVLARNPEFLIHITKKLITSKDREYKFKDWDLDIEKKAYKNFLENKFSELIK